LHGTRHGRREGQGEFCLPTTATPPRTGAGSHGELRLMEIKGANFKLD